MKYIRPMAGFIGAMVLLLVAVSHGMAEPGKDEIEGILAKVRSRPEEERWRLVPWQHSLKKGFEAAKASNRPLFFFGYDGILDTGNC